MSCEIPIRVVVAVLLACGLRAEIVDRIAVSVGYQVVTTSDIERQIRVSAFLAGVAPDLNAANRRKVADAMVEQRLIKRELETNRYPVPAAAEVEPLAAEFQKKYFKSEEDYRKALAERGITAQDVNDELLWERTLLRFIEVRFRPAVQVTIEDIRDYFTKTVEPAARAAHPDQPVTLEDFSAGIEKTLTGQRQEDEMNRWLKDARTRTEIVYHDEALQ